LLFAFVSVRLRQAPQLVAKEMVSKTISSFSRE